MYSEYIMYNKKWEIYPIYSMYYEKLVKQFNQSLRSHM